MKKIKKMALAFGAAALGLAITGCNNNTTPTSGNNTTTNTQTETTTGGSGETTTPSETTTTGGTPTTSTYAYPSRNDKDDVTPAVINKEAVTVNVSSDSLFVKKVENLDDNFIFGMDSSSVISLEESGVKYYDYDGNEADLFKVLAESGINYVRVRIWNDPYDSDGNGYGGGNNDIEKAVEIGERVTKYGMKLLVNFHYSDFWADPAKQKAPKAWADYDIYEKCDALYDYTYESLLQLYAAGVDVGMVQVGNETTSGMSGETDWKNVSMLMNAGSKAIREIYPDALVAVHFTNPEKAGKYADFARRLRDNNVDYDVFASSYYPYWHGTLDNLAKVLNTVSSVYGKKVMIAETSYANTTADSDSWGNTIGTPSTTDGNKYDYPITLAGQTNHIVNLVDTCVNSMTDCLGVFYWEGTWISVGNDWATNQTKWEKYGSGWASSYAAEYDPKDAGKWYGGCAVDNQAFFDPTGHPLETLKVWALMKDGNTSVPKYVDGAESVEVTFLTDDTIVLPNKVNVVYNDNTTASVDVTWDFPDSLRESIPTGGNKDYVIVGTIDESTQVECLLHVLMTNYIPNYSFEEMEQGKLSKWVYEVTGTLNDTYKVTVTGENPKSGDQAFHFWANNANTVKFNVHQEITGLAAGTYNYHLGILGGANSSPADASKQNIYMYVLINGEEKYRTAMNFTTYNDGYKVYSIEGIEIAADDVVTVGFYCEANEAGSWGDFDDALLNLVG